MTTSPRPFAVDGPLPTGRLAIEASAGTGKTFTLAALATRFVAERGVAAGELLIVTFTRAATSELRARIRERFVAAARYLDEGCPGDDPDPLHRHLATGDRELARERLEQAVTEFDAASITTIHGFAAQVLATLGAASDAEPDLPLVDDAKDLCTTVCADVLAAAALAGHQAEHLPKPSDLEEVTKQLLDRPDLVLAPRPGQAGASDAHHLLRDLALEAAQRVEALRRRTGTRSFGDVLTHLRDALAGPGGQAVSAALRNRYRVALIDEFQDTDPVQWDIFRRLFSDDGGVGTSLILVGDPKQAIYAFRGADIRTYLEAVSSGTDIRTLETNWRSDQAALDAVGALFEGATFGDEGIAFTPVDGAPGHRSRRLVDLAGRPMPGMVLRHWAPEVEPGGGGSREMPVMDDVQRAVWRDMVGQIRGLLDSAAVPADDGDRRTGQYGASAGTRRLRPSDIAVLVRTKDQADETQEALRDAGIPAVLARGGSVLGSPAAEQWRWLLAALARPADVGRARTYALSWFEGHDIAWIDSATDDELAGIQDRLHGWAEALTLHGVDELLRRVRSETGVTERVLARPDGDREITDLDHIAELLRTQVDPGRVGAAGLMAVLEADPAVDLSMEADTDVASRRIETEAEAVQVMTIWVSKGLEFAVTVCPTLWRQPRANGTVLYHDPEEGEGGARVLDVAGGKAWPDKVGATQRKRRATEEEEGEQLRLLYVSLTRARHQTLVWWARAKGSESTAIARVLFARTEPSPSDESPGDRLDGLATSVAPEEAVPVPSPIEASGAPGDSEVTDDGPPPQQPSLFDLVEDEGGGEQSGSIRADGSPAASQEPVKAVARWLIDPVAYRAPKVVLPEPADPDEAHRRLQALAATAPVGTLSVVRVPVQGPVGERWVDPVVAAGEPTVSIATIDRRLDRSRSRWSFTGITAREHDVDVDVDAAGAFGGGSDEQRAEDPTDPVTPDEEVPDETVAPAGQGSGHVSPLAALPAGAAFGILTHSLFEHVDFTDPDLRSAVDRELERELAWRSFDLTPVEAEATAAEGRRRLVDGIVAAIDTPLGPILGDRRLRDVPSGDRLDELTFELRLADGGVVPDDRAIGRLAVRHLPHDDPFRPWAEGLATGRFRADLAGHLTGSIDAVLRVPLPASPDHPTGDGHRYVVVDYKTNRLHPRGEVPGPDAYGPAAMAASMADHHYPLQALLYSVGLHRYLRWRLPGYRPEVHLGGAAYLFVRGMSGPAVTVGPDGRPHGVCSWAIPPPLVEDLSSLLDGRPPEATP